MGADPRPPGSLALRRVAAGLAAAACLLLLPLRPNATPARAGAWLRAPGEVYAKAGLFRQRGAEEYDAGGDPRPLYDPALFDGGRYLEAGGGFYGELGLTRDVTLLADLVLKAATVEATGRGGAGDLTGRAFGIPDVRVGVRLPLLRGRIVAAVEPSVSIPLVPAGTDDPDGPRLGTGSAAFAASLSAGTAIPALRAYAQAGGGYRARAGKPPDDRFWDLEVGGALLDWLRVRLRYDGVDAAALRGAGSVATSLAAETGGQDAHRIAPTLGVALRGGGEISVTWRRTFAGRSALRGREWEVAYAFLGLIRPSPPPHAPRPD